MFLQIAGNKQNLLMWVGTTMLIVLCLFLAKAILLPIVLALLLTFILNPVVNVLQKLRLGRVPAVLVTTGCSFSVLVLFGWLFSRQMADLAHEIPDHKEQIAAKIADLHGLEQRTIGSITGFLQELTNDDNAGHNNNERPEPLNVVIEQSKYLVRLSWIGLVVGPLFEQLVACVFLAALVILMLIHRENLRNRILRLAGPGQLVDTTRVLDDVAHRISRFLFLQALINCLFGMVLGLGLLFLGVPYALLFALLAAAMRFVPYLGTVVTAGLLLLVEFLLLPGWTTCWLTIALLAVLEGLIAYVIEPLLFGRTMGISPVGWLVAAAFWSWLWGPIGLLLSTPMTVSLSVLGKYVPNLAFLNVLLGDEPVLQEPIRFYQRLLARDQDEAVDVIDAFVKEHGVDAAVDDVLIPALILAKRDLTGGALTSDQASRIFQDIRQIFEENVALHEEVHEGGQVNASVTVLGYAAHDEVDEIALEMLSRILEVRGVTVRAMTSRALVSIVVDAVRNEDPSIVVIAALPDGSLAHSRYLCKKLRAAMPTCQIILGRWGLTEHVEEASARVQREGAKLHVRMAQTADWIHPAPQPPSEPVSSAATTAAVLSK